MKIQPIDCGVDERIRVDFAKPAMKSRLRRLFDRPFTVLVPRGSSTAMMIEKPVIVDDDELEMMCDTSRVELSEFEPSSVCLTKMVQNFIEESHEKPAAAAVKCGRRRCSCFHGNNTYSSDDEFDVVFGSSGDLIHSSDSVEILKSLVPCTSAAERNLLADTARIINDNKTYKRKCDLIKIVVDGLATMGYTASICKSRWDKSPSHPAGEYEYIDAIVGDERLLIDVDFKSEFEMARSTSTYKAILHSLPYIFIGKSDRLQQIVSIVSEAAKQSLMKKDMFFPPWRKAEYMKAKWLSPYTKQATTLVVASHSSSPFTEKELIFGGQMSLSDTNSGEFYESSPVRNSFGDEKKSDQLVVSRSPWQPPAIKPRSFNRGAKVVTGLAFLLQETS